MTWQKPLVAALLTWLLAEENPTVRYWTWRDLLDRPASDLEVQAARAAIPALFLSIRGYSVTPQKVG